MGNEHETDADLLERVTKSRAALLNLVTARDTSASDLWAVARLGTDEMRLHVASAPKLPEDLQLHLATHGDAQTKLALTYRQSLSPAMFEALANGASEALLTRLCGRRDAPRQLVAEASRAHGVQVRLASIRSGELEPEALVELMRDDEAEVRSAAQNALVDRTMQLVPEAWAEDTSRFLASHPDLTPTAAESLARRTSRDVRATLAANPRTPAKVLDGLAQDKEMLVRLVVLAHPSLPSSALDRLLKDPSSQVREMLARRTDLGVERLLLLAYDEDRAVRETVAARPQLPRAVVEVLAHAKDPLIDELLAQGRDDGAQEVSLRALWDELDASLAVSTNGYLRGLLERGLRDHLREDRPRLDVVESLLESVDRGYARMLDAILHDPRFQAMEQRWCGLFSIVDAGYLIRRPQQQGLLHPGGVTLEFVNVSKEDLVADFDDAPDYMRSGLYKLIYSSEYGPFGGRPYGLLGVDFAFEGTLADLRLLRSVATIARDAALVVATTAAPSLLGRETEDVLAEAGPRALEGAVASAWGALQEDPISRHVVLFTQQIASRSAWRCPWKNDRPSYDESIERSCDAPWISGLFALMQAVTRSFHYWRVSSHVTGLEDGRFTGAASFERDDKKPSLSFELGNAEADFAGAGFATLRSGPNGPWISFAPTFHTGDSGAPELGSGDRLRNRQASGVLWVTRWMQVLKVLQREQIGTWRERAELEHELNLFLQAYCRLQQSRSPSALLATRPPLHTSAIRLELGDHAGYYQTELTLQPGWRVDGMYPTLKLHNRLDRE